MRISRVSFLGGIGSFAIVVTAPSSVLAAPGITLINSFDGSNGATPYAALTAAGNGLYYGTTSEGGALGQGAIFEFDSASGAITLKDSFNGSNGAGPDAALTAAGNSIYYGTTTRGGANDQGAVFEFDSTSGSITLKASFNGANGREPVTELTAAGNGIYYGVTESGGINDLGSVFEFNSTSGSITIKNSFNGTNGSQPEGALIAAGNGLYYGTTRRGGASNQGVVFEFDSTSGFITLKDSFNGTNGSSPITGLTPAGNSLYYGTSWEGGNGNGTIFEFDSASGTITLVDSFAADGSNGESPLAELTAAGNGIFYGTTQEGGANNEGVVFEFDSNSGKINLKDSFDSSIGGSHASLMAAENGIFYGTAYGGVNGLGTVIAFDPANGSSVPGPLPLMGAGAAFGWSRKLRRRIHQVRPVFPIVPEP